MASVQVPVARVTRWPRAWGLLLWLALSGMVNAVAAPKNSHPCLGDIEAWSMDQTALYWALSGLYEAEQFEDLDRALGCLLATRERLASGHMAASGAYEFYRGQMPTPGLEPSQAGRVERWRRRLPKSIFAEFAALRLSYSLAWAQRGGDYYQQTPTENIRRFHATLDDTTRAIAQASPGLQATVLWHHLRLAVWQDTPGGAEQARRAYDEGVRKWPGFYEFHSTRIGRMTPRWRGSWEALDAFATRTGEAYAATEGKAVYARLYLHLFWYGTVPSETSANWPRLRDGLYDLVDRYPTLAHINMAGSVACLYGDKQAYQRVMNRLPAYAPGLWMHGTGIDNCSARMR